MLVIACPVTLNEVLDRAAAMEPTTRWEVFTTCGTHDRRTLPRLFPGSLEARPYYCPQCYTVFSAAGFVMWNPPADPSAD
jgi:hypothetical protein